MAAPMVTCISPRFCKIFSKSCHLPSKARQLCAIRYKSISSSNDINTYESQYPPIKPRYPEGNWTDVSEKAAWAHHEAGEKVAAIPKIKDRLENMAGCHTEPKQIWQIRGTEVTPGSLKFKQYITKTAIISENELPEIYDNQTIDDELIAKAKHIYEDQFLKINEYHYRKTIKSRKRHDINDEEPRIARQVMGGVLRTLCATLWKDNPHLLRAQFDEDVRVESFWKRSGYTYDTKDLVPGANQYGIILYQMRNRASHQIRIENPLPQVVPMDSGLSIESEVPKYNYNPFTYQIRREATRPITMSGHWLGDPCEFNLLQSLCMDEQYHRIAADYGEEMAMEESLGIALCNAFGSATAHAHNQGFNWFWDLTYPFVTQVVLTDGHWMRFMTYQLNTIHMWKPDAANPRNNLAWASPIYQLYESVDDNGRLVGLNDIAFTQLLRFVTEKPAVMTPEELRPYANLQAEAMPRDTNMYIANKGDEQLPQFKPERFEYPEKSVYYQ